LERGGSKAGAVIAPDCPAVTTSAWTQALLVCAQPKLAFVRAAARLCPPQRRTPGVHAAATIDRTAMLGADVAIAERVSIEAGARIGDRTQIAPGVVIGRDVTVGCDCDIKPNVVIYAGTTLGDRVVVHAGAVLGSDGFGFVPDRTTGRYEKFPQVGWLGIGNDVEIGANVTLDRGALGATVIADGVKFDNLVHIGHNVHVGRNTVMAAQVGVAGSSTIGESVMMGGQAGIGAVAHVGDGVMLGGQAGVLSGKVLNGKGVVFWGTPAKPLREILKELAALARLVKR
jgi:UDP-3-O-[3-hydroxymyristoyl] glucosamine N-acyltransferase